MQRTGVSGNGGKRRETKKNKEEMRERRFELPTFAYRIPKDGYECDIITTRQLAL